MYEADRDAWYPTFDPSALPRVLSRAEAVALGYTPSMIAHQIRSGRWQRVLPRTYLTAGSLTWPARLTAALTYAGTDAVITAAAALADDLRGVARPTRVMVLVPLRSGHRSTGWVQVRPTERLPVRRLAPGPARAPFERAVADLALERRRVDDVRALVTEAVRRRLCTVDELAAELAAGPRRGSAHLRQAIAEASAGAWSAPEARAATLLRTAGVPSFEQNVRIDLPGGRHIVVDFLWRKLKAVLEIDSMDHHSLPGDRDATDDRHLVLETVGYSVVHRTPWTVINRPQEFVTGIQAWLAARTQLPAR
jgi:very-short-patch-repair endonuclease